MANYTEPSQTEYSSNEQVMLDIMSTAYPTLITKMGSVIRELVIRPVAYLYAWLTANMNNNRKTSNVAYLQTSQAAKNDVADAVASNYFVKRRQGTRSKGVVTLTINTELLQIPKGAMFVIDGTPVYTEYRTMAVDSSTSGLVNDVMYAILIPYGSYYMVNIPVVAAEPGKVEISPGATVTVGFGSTNIVNVELTSAITGGSDTETDAELMERAAYNTAESGIGSYYGIKKKLNNAPVTIFDLGLIAGEDLPMYRARYNSVNINPGGFIDCYIKTQNQYAVNAIATTAVYQAATDDFLITLHDSNTAGLYGIKSIILDNSADTTNDDIVINNYTVSFGTASTSGTWQGSRLGVDQTTLITFEAEGTSDVPAVVYVYYMPGISIVQSYMNTSSNKFIGQDTKIKAAVPVTVHISCVLDCAKTLSDDVLENIKQAMADCVNAHKVGTTVLNFSTLVETCRRVTSDAVLKLPCVISADIFTRTGGIDTFYSNTGILDISNPVNQNYWDPTVCYFSLIPSNIRLDII